MKKLLNIILGVLMAVSAAITLWAVVTGGAPIGAYRPDLPGWNPAINIAIIWTYVLFVLAILVAIGGAVYCATKSSGNFKTTGLALLLIVVIVGASTYLAISHTFVIRDIANNDVFARFPTVIAEASIYVTYAAFVIACITALYTAVADSLK